MTQKDLELLLEEGEGFQLEFKRKVSSAEKIARAMIGFANTRGGTILFGIDDDKRVVGVESEKSELELITVAGTYHIEPPIEPLVEIIPYKGKDVIAVTIEESKDKPHSLIVDEEDHYDSSSRVFIRVHDKTMAASREVEKILRSEQPDAPPLRIEIGAEERRLFDYLEQNERVTVKEFAKLVNVSQRRASRMLIKLVRAGVLRIHTHDKEDYFTVTFE